MDHRPTRGIRGFRSSSIRAGSARWCGRFLTRIWETGRIPLRDRSDTCHGTIKRLRSSDFHRVPAEPTL
jgi:hypothetical protein